ncbi:MAG: c-type cytochrome [Planctomycetes bacterium]|nr:c-type cytochrome [Planctomycetota bacterium]
MVETVKHEVEFLKRLLVFTLPAALFLLSVLVLPGGTAPAGDETGEGGPDHWTAVHRARAEEGRERLKRQLEALDQDPEAPLAAVAEKVAKREAALAGERAELLKKIEEARREADRIQAIHDFYAGGMERADLLYADALAIDLRFNQLESDVKFLESYVPVVRKRIELTDDPDEKKELELSLENDLLAPLREKKARIEEIRGERDCRKGARDAYYAFYESRMQTYMAEMNKAQAKVKLLEEDLSNVPFDLDEEKPALALSKEETKVWERASRLEKALAATPEIREEAVSVKCLLCHFTADEAYFMEGRLAYADHPPLAERADDTCEGCHGGDPSALDRPSAGHEAMVPPSLVIGAPVDVRGKPRSLFALGEEIYDLYRCRACHELPGEDPIFRKAWDLEGLHGRIGFDWAIQSLTRPEVYPERYTMPRYGLTEAQAQKIALFLWQSKHVHGATVHAENAPDKKPEGIEEEGEKDAGGGQGDGQELPRRTADLAGVVTGYDVSMGSNLFHDLGCLGCHQVRGTEEPAGVTESMADMGLRLARPYPPANPVYPAGTVIDREVLDLLKRDGVRSIDVLSESPLDPILIDQRAVLAEGYPPDDPIYPAGTTIDQEVYDFLRKEKVVKVRLSARGSDFAPDLTHSGNKLKKPHLVAWLQDPGSHLAGATMPNFRLDEKEAWLVATYLDHRRAASAPPPIRKGLWTDLSRQVKDGFVFVLSASAPRLAVGREVDFVLEVRREETGRPIEPREFPEFSAAIQTVRPSGETPWLEIYPFVEEGRGAFVLFFRFEEAAPHRLRTRLSAGPDEPLVEVVFDLAVRPKEVSIETEGKTLVASLGCSACHDIPELEKNPPSIADLGEFAMECVEEGKITGGGAEEVVASLTDAIVHHAHLGGEKGAIYSWKVDDVETRALAAYIFDRARRGNSPPRSAREAVLHHGKRILDRFNCRGCHKIGPGEKGGSYGPNLGIAGLRYRPAYLVRFLEAPDPVRTGAGNAVMPTFNMTGEDREDLALYFQELIRGTREAELVRAAAAAFSGVENGDPVRGEELVKEHRCRSCHLIGDDKKPLDDFTDYTREDLERHRTRAPRLVDLANRLDPDWMAAWIMDPRKFLPDTAMPDPEITLADAASIREYLLTFRTPPPKKPDGENR